MPNSSTTTITEFAKLLGAEQDPIKRVALLKRAEMMAMSEASDSAFETRTLLDQRVKLGEIVRCPFAPYEFLPTKALGEKLSYLPSLFMLSGHKKSGNSWAMAATGLDCIQNGRPVVYLDYENGEKQFSRRLKRLGADPERLDALFYYVPWAKGLTLANFQDELEDIATSLPGAFVVIDSLRTLLSKLSLPGNPLKVNDEGSIGLVCDPMMDVVKSKDIVIGIID